MIPGKLKKAMLTVSVPLAVLSATALIYISVFMPETGFNQSGRKKPKSAAYAVLKEIRDIYSLNTAEFTLKVIFPYDFIEPGIDWQELKYYYDTDKEKFREKSHPGYYPDNRLPVTWEYSHFYAQCRGAGYELAKTRQDFFIITATVKAGYDLENYPNLTENKLDKPLEDYIRITQEKTGEKILYIKKPDTIITEFIIEDNNLNALGYPDVALSPEQWRVLIHYLSPKIKSMVIFKGILKEADANGCQLLTQILVGSGFDHVVFF